MSACRLQAFWRDLVGRVDSPNEVQHGDAEGQAGQLLRLGGEFGLEALEVDLPLHIRLQLGLQQARQQQPPLL